MKEVHVPSLESNNLRTYIYAILQICFCLEVYSLYVIMIVEYDILILQAPTPQNGQTHSSYSAAIVDEYFSVFDYLVGLALKGLN